MCNFYVSEKIKYMLSVQFSGDFNKRIYLF